MRRILWLSLLAVQPAFAFDYRMTFDQTCSYAPTKRTYPCEKSDQPVTELKEIKGRWFGTNPGSKDSIELQLVMDDQYILVLRNPVYYSGVSMIHMMKKTGRFYWTETSYSEILKMDDSRVRVGSFTLNFQR